MDRKQNAREIDILLWYVERVEDQIQTEEQLVAWQDRMQYVIQVLVNVKELEVEVPASSLRGAAHFALIAIPR